MQLLRQILALVVAFWSGLAIYSHNAPTDAADVERAGIELRCRYGQCEDRDMALLARYRSFATGVSQDPQLVRSLLLQSPASPELWCDLAEAHREQGNLAEGERAFQHAISLAPNSPHILLRSATANLLDGRKSDALPLFRRIFDKVPGYPADNVFGLCSRFGVTTTEILESVLPTGQPIVAASYLRFLMRVDKAQDAVPAWNWIATHRLDTPALSSEFAAFLLHKKNSPQAFSVWSAKREYTLPNLIYNPGFEKELEPGPFSWRLDTMPGVSASVDTAEKHEGRRALVIRFAGLQNLSYQNVSQTVPASSGLHTISAWMKAEHLTTDQGLHLAALDAERGSVLWKSEPMMTGTMPWTKVTQSFTVPPGTSLLRIVLLRNASTKIDSKIKGNLWLDEVKLLRTP